MVNKEIDKRTLIVFLDAVTNSEGRLRDYHRHVQGSGQELPDLFRRQYAGVRRLRETFLRMSEGARAVNSIDLTEEDANLLASCLADALPELDKRLSGRVADEEERAWLIEQRDLLMSEARSLMSEPLHAILAFDAMSRVTPSVRTLQSRIPTGSSMPFGQIRLGSGYHGDEPERTHPAQNPYGSMPGFVPGASEPGRDEYGGEPGYGTPGGYGSPGFGGSGPGNMPPNYPPPGYPQPGYPQQAPRPGPGYGAPGYSQPGYAQSPTPFGGGYGGGPGGGVGPGRGGLGGPGVPGMPGHSPGYDGSSSGYDSPDARPSGLNVVRNAFHPMDVARRPDSASAHPSALAPEMRPVASEARIESPLDFLFDPNVVRDHRVRAQIRLDLRDLSRAEAVDDHRMMLVHLGSLLEGLLLDHGLRNRKELGLGEGPDIWDYHALAVQVLGSGLSAEQEPVLGILHACRRLLRPSCQIVHPIVVTPKMVADSKAFLEWSLARLGFVEGADSLEAPSARGSSAALWRATNRGS
ncbi:MAG: hypothetical protein H6832_00445 [Planctomycetes bacterium]|nr:hypothetical protein [Planctomycetota bacterium]MCB9916851.1 hypothetical protein [Planctomycetota bacterium]